ncbi:hypothetical protein R1flu_024100 [Riccia fluitans]|uniref:Protein kinase domain-containing protein n=1 Tax=Riccia fluitans TaxID=41844 RepID=A0ABD1XUS3_9MARC
MVRSVMCCLEFIRWILFGEESEPVSNLDIDDVISEAEVSSRVLTSEQCNYGENAPTSVSGFEQCNLEEDDATSVLRFDECSLGEDAATSVSRFEECSLGVHATALGEGHFDIDSEMEDGEEPGEDDRPTSVSGFEQCNLEEDAATSVLRFDECSLGEDAATSVSRFEECSLGVHAKALGEGHSDIDYEMEDGEEPEEDDRVTSVSGFEQCNLEEDAATSVLRFDECRLGEDTATSVSRFEECSLGVHATALGEGHSDIDSEMEDGEEPEEDDRPATSVSRFEECSLGVLSTALGEVHSDVDSEMEDGEEPEEDDRAALGEVHSDVDSEMEDGEESEEDDQEALGEGHSDIDFEMEDGEEPEEDDRAALGEVHSDIDSEMEDGEKSEENDREESDFVPKTRNFLEDLKRRVVVKQSIPNVFGYSGNFSSKYQIGEEIGSGGFGTVHIAKGKEGEMKDVYVAVKVISKAEIGASIDDIEGVKREVEILTLLSRFNTFLQFHGAYEDNMNIYIVMEGGCSEDDAKLIIRQVLKIVSVCHMQGIVHCDIKPENLMFMSEDHDSPIRLIDFGLAEFIPPDGLLSNPVGTVGFIAPEVLRGEYGTGADIWCIGVITYFLLSGNWPFGSDGDLETYKAALCKYMNGDAITWPLVSFEAKDFLQQLLNTDMKNRFSASQALAHPWIQTNHTRRSQHSAPVLNRTVPQTRQALSVILEEETEDDISMQDVITDEAEQGAFQVEVFQPQVEKSFEVKALEQRFKEEVNHYKDHLADVVKKLQECTEQSIARNLEYKALIESYIAFEKNVEHEREETAALITRQADKIAELQKKVAELQVPRGNGMSFLHQHDKFHLSASGATFTRLFEGQIPTSCDEVGYPCTISSAASGIGPGSIVAISSDGRHLFTGGHTDNSVKVVKTKNAESADARKRRLVQLSEHVLGVGSKRRRIEVSERVLRGGDAHGGVDCTRKHMEGPHGLHVLRDHDDKLICCAVNVDLDLLVTSSLSKGVLVHSITTGRLLQKLPTARADALTVSSDGNIILWDQVERILHIFTMNGAVVASRVFQLTYGSITSVVFSSDGLHIVMATSQAVTVSPDRIWQGSQNQLVFDADQTGAASPSCSCVTGQELNGGYENGQHQLQDTRHDSAPTIIILKTSTLEVVQRLCLQSGQDLTTVANSNLCEASSVHREECEEDDNAQVKRMDIERLVHWREEEDADEVTSEYDSS